MSKPNKLAANLELILPDTNGVPRGKTIKSADYDDSMLPQLASAIFFQCIHGDYSAAGINRFDPKDEDCLLNADWATYRPSPAAPDTAQVIVESLDKQRNPLPYDPRNVLKRVLEQFSQEGLTPVVAPELEFYLVQPPKRHDLAIHPARGTHQGDEFGGDAFNPDALQKYAPFVAALYKNAADANIELSALVHEMGPAQIELNVTHGEALAKADELILLKRMVKATAINHGYLSSFMAKPMTQQPGSGLHLHCSVLQSNNSNLFTLNDRRAPDELRHFIGGLQTHLPDALALIAPFPNSYKRFVRDLSAPVNLAWGYDNRTTGLRVPYGPPNAGRVENRVSGADANPYLLMAVTLGCGWLGLQQKIEPDEPREDDAYELEANLPEDLASALNRLERNQALVDLFSEEFIFAFTTLKREELSSYAQQITPWEVGYLGSVV